MKIQIPDSQGSKTVPYNENILGTMYVILNFLVAMFFQKVS